MPIYRVKMEGRTTRMVDAPNSTAARNHVLKPLVVVCEPIDAREALLLSKDGVELETVGAEPAAKGGE